MRLALVVILGLLVLSGCSADSVWAPEEEVQRARYTHDGPPHVALFTMVSNETNTGQHTALMVSGSQRVIFNPAGTFNHPQLPERNDVHFGINEKALDFFIDYHARITYHVAMQTVEVPPEVAELVLQRVQEYGPVPPAACSNSISRVLRGVPGFEPVRGLFPNTVRKTFGRVDGVSEELFYDDSPDHRTDIVAYPAPNLR